MRIKKGDNVAVISGKDRGKKGKVLRAFPRVGKIVVEGVYMHKKHVKPKRSGQKGQTIEMPGAFSVSNVKLVCGKCGAPSRVRYQIEESRKVRVCKKCQAPM